MPLETIYVFNHAHEAHLARTKLASEGIEAFVIDDHSPYPVPVVGVRLQVREADVAAARQALGIEGEGEGVKDGR